MWLGVKCVTLKKICLNMMKNIFYVFWGSYFCLIQNYFCCCHLSSFSSSHISQLPASLLLPYLYPDLLLLHFSSTDPPSLLLLETCYLEEEDLLLEDRDCSEREEVEEPPVLLLLDLVTSEEQLVEVVEDLQVVDILVHDT